MSESQVSSSPVVTPRLAATVLIARPAGQGFEIFVQLRPKTMRFAPGMAVFPGGAVEDQDWDVAQDEGCAASDEIVARQFEVSVAQAAALRRAAVREVAEESGIQLDSSGSKLVPWANWVTPRNAPKRFDTFFYVAVLGGCSGGDANGDECDVPAWGSSLTSESTVSLWSTPQDLLAEFAAGKMPMMAPTWAEIRRLAQYETLEELCAVCKSIGCGKEGYEVARIDDDLKHSATMTEFYRIRRDFSIAVGDGSDEH